MRGFKQFRSLGINQLILFTALFCGILLSLIFGAAYLFAENLQEKYSSRINEELQDQIQQATRSSGVIYALLDQQIVNPGQQEIISEMEYLMTEGTPKITARFSDEAIENRLQQFNLLHTTYLRKVSEAIESINASDTGSANRLKRELFAELKEIYRVSENLRSSINNRIQEKNEMLVTETGWYKTAILMISILMISGLVAFAAFSRKKLNYLLDRILSQLNIINAGNIPEEENSSYGEINEIHQSINQISHALEDVRSIAISVGNGEFENNVTVFENEGQVGEAMMSMRSSLKQVAVDSENRNWLNTGYAKFGDILRENNTDIDQLTEQVIIQLVKYLDANQGALFLTEGEGEEETLKMVSCYAFERRKKAQGTISKGDGLVGQAWLENDAIFLTDVPEEYVNIRSGLGDAPPRSIVVVPLSSNEETVGVIELASFQVFAAHEQEFIRKVSETIAVAISNTRRNEQTNTLLAESQQMTEEMRAQEEEMRQNMEELEATQEEMNRAQQEIARKEFNLNALINNTEDTIFALDQDYRITVVNDTLKNKYANLGIKLEPGSFIYDALNKDQWAVWKPRYDRALQGERYSKIEERGADDERTWIETFHNPIYDQHNQVIGVSVIARNITEFMKAQVEATQQSSILSSLIDNTEDTFFALNLSYQITVVNKALKDRFLSSGIELNVGDDIFSKLPEETHEIWKERYDRSLAGESFVIDQERQVNDKTLYIRGYYNPVYNDRGEIIGASVSSKDITKIREAEVLIQNQ